MIPLLLTVLIVFRDDVADVRSLADELARQSGGEVAYVYRHALKGCAIRNVRDVEKIRAHPAVRDS